MAFNPGGDFSDGGWAFRPGINESTNSTVMKSQDSTGVAAGGTHQGGRLMLWIFFTLVMAVWTLRTIFLFGGSALPIVLVVWLAALALWLVTRRSALHSRRLHDFNKTGKLTSIRKLSNSPAPSVSNSICVDNKTKEQYL